MNEYIVLEGLSQEVGTFTMGLAHWVPPRRRQRAFIHVTGPSRAVLVFRAPTWEAAKAVFEWAQYGRRQKIYRSILSWRRIRGLMQKWKMRELDWKVKWEVLQCIVDDKLKEGT